MYLLDTNIVSLLDPRRHKTNPGLIDWLLKNGSMLYLSAMTVAEIEAGILKLIRQGKTARAEELNGFLKRLLNDFASHVLPMDAAVALQVARLGDEVRATPIELADLIIAGTAKRHGLVLLTANTKHFERLPVPEPAG